VKITYYGQSCFLFEWQGKNVLIDPFISPNKLASHINVDEIPADFILVSHGHEDHVADLVSVAKRTGAQVISSYEIIQWLGKQGVSNGYPMNLGGAKDFDFGWVKMMFAAHSSSLPDGSYGGTAAGFIIKTEGKTLYYSGDTALIADMKLTGELFQIDQCFFPIGDNFTMGVEDAILASKFVKCNDIIGMHFDTFPYIEINKEEAVMKFKEAGLNLRLLEIGETIEL
jgi:L-ascorbate metabolism protein UlaG (beta-lactamase superfamily)